MVETSSVKSTRRDFRLVWGSHLGSAPTVADL
jgi:hypothetical protein